MVIGFFGHRDFCASEAYKKKLLHILDTLVGDEAVDFYLGGYGEFDAFAYQCCNEYKKMHPRVKLIFITPYLLSNRLQEQSEKYDCVVYPALEKIPPKFAISYRNRYMVENSDIIISYVRYNRGGAYQACLYAQKRKKRIISLETEELSKVL